MLIGTLVLVVGLVVILWLTQPASRNSPPPVSYRTYCHHQERLPDGDWRITTYKCED